MNQFVSTIPGSGVFPPSPYSWQAKAVNNNQKLKNGKIYCTICGKKKIVDSEKCLSNGWPKCCGQTMVLDCPNK